MKPDEEDEEREPAEGEQLLSEAFDSSVEQVPGLFVDIYLPPPDQDIKEAVAGQIDPDDPQAAQRAALMADILTPEEGAENPAPPGP